MNPLSKRTPEAWNLRKLLYRGGAYGSSTLKVLEQCFPSRRSDARQSVEAATQRAPIADLAVVPNRRVMRLISQVLHHPKGGTVVRQPNGILHVG